MYVNSFKVPWMVYLFLYLGFLTYPVSRVSYRLSSCYAINTYNAADESRRHVNKTPKTLKNVKILEFGDDIQIHHEKCIE